MDFVLVRVQSDGRSKPSAIKHAKTVLGRQTGCQLRIRSGEVSRRHCEIDIEEGSAVIRDLGSRNGTYVNGVRVSEKRLEAGDLIAVGPVVLMVQIDGQPEPSDAAELFRSGLPGAGVSAGTAGTSGVSDQSPTKAGLMDDLGIKDAGGDASDESSVIDFDFDFEDEEEEQRSQPPL
ncbi:MAG TPA: FHA domain-containing protein [Phycisphaerales bacterium]|nr:FHA domain-containing protein [Phycisphaerales bacterium]